MYIIHSVVHTYKDIGTMSIRIRSGYIQKTRKEKEKEKGNSGKGFKQDSSLLNLSL